MNEPISPRLQKRVWRLVSWFPLPSLWSLDGVSVWTAVKHVWFGLFEDNIASRAAELGFYFIFALFPALFAATSLLGMIAGSSSHLYDSLIAYLSLALPPAAMGTVLNTFRQITSSANGGKLTFGLAVSLWSASVGFAAIQDGLNIIYQVKETRSYLTARLSAIGVTILLSILITLMLGSLLGADYIGKWAEAYVHPHLIAVVLIFLAKAIGWTLVLALLLLVFAVIYYFAPNVQRSRWHWITPGATVGILGWVLACILFRIYVHQFNTYTVTYGSLGAVIILLTWFYLTGFMLLLGAEINSQIEAVITSKRVLERDEAKRDGQASEEA
jgi:membrane protein